MAEQDLSKMFAELDSLLGSSDISDVTAESAGFAELPEGYYLCEVEESKLTESKTSHKPMAAFRMKVVEDGLAVNVGADDTVSFVELKGTANRKIFINYVLKDEQSVRRFVTDMLKFEGENPGESLLPKEAFTNSETLEDAIDVLQGMRIYVNVSKSEKDDGSVSTWNNLVSWKRAAKLELPM